MSDKIKYSYEKLTELILQNIEKLQKENFDCIIAISSGGLFPAVLVKNILKIPMYTIAVSSYSNEKRGDIKPLQWINNNFENQKVLVIDEIDSEIYYAESKKLKSKINDIKQIIKKIDKKLDESE